MQIVFASLGSLGDLHPLLALARASCERGHTVVIATSETYRDYIASLGFAFRPIRPDFEPTVLGRLFDPHKGPQRLLCEQIFTNVRKTYEDLLEASRDADFLFVGELLYVAPLVADKLGIPWANGILAPTSFLSALDAPVLAPAQALHCLRHLGNWPYRLIFALGRRETIRWSKPLRDFRQELGFPAGPSPVFDGKHSPRLVLALFPEFLAKPELDWPVNVTQTGFPFFSQSIKPETAKKLDVFFAGGEAPIVFTLGTSVVHIAENFYQLAAEAAQALGRRAILLIGKNPAPANLPESILAIDYAPLEAVLPRAAAVVHQGGIGTCAEALRAGIPSLVIPFGFDQPDNGFRLKRLGVARVLHRDRVSRKSLVKNLNTILKNSAMTARARTFAGKIHPEFELNASIDAIEKIGAQYSKPAELQPS
ncbi:MAG: glycosyltransferase [Chthoniobacterales bacterium]